MDEPDITEILDGSPSNWNKWGEDDEIGAINYLSSSEVLRGIQAVREGEIFALGTPIAGPKGEPVSPSRGQADHYMKRDKGDYEAGKINREDYAGMESADDVIQMFVQGTTHYDALGHAWYNDNLYNGFPASTTKEGLEFADISPIAKHGVVGRGILLDLPMFFGVKHLEQGQRITLDNLKNCADDQNVEIQKRDILLIRTGWVERFYGESPEAIFDDFDEPGLTYTEELCEWFDKMEIPLFGTDTIASEQTLSETTGTRIPLHGALLRDLGIVFSEVNKLDELAKNCESDGKYDFLYVGSPLKIVGGTGSPVNPLAIR